MDGVGGGAATSRLPTSGCTPSCFRHLPAGPPLRPLKRFLSSFEGVEFRPATEPTLQASRNSVLSDDGRRPVRSTPPAALPLPPTTTGAVPRGVLLDESSFMGGLLVDGDGSIGVAADECFMRFVDGNGNEMQTCGGGMKQSSSAASTTSLVKGQWTADEDSLLVKLVKQHGVRKWSQIAKKLAGRIGKQCRERWHNHLRPDIKKDTWSEEEERLLVEAHEMVGNRWAEISKLIPGRTENSIKNHWNATKRRQNSRKKTKKKANQDDNPQPSILQDYIKRRILLDTCAPTQLMCQQLPSLPVPLPLGSDSSALTTASMDEDKLMVEEFFVDSLSPTVTEDMVLMSKRQNRFDSAEVPQAPHPNQASHACDYDEILHFLDMDRCDLLGTSPELNSHETLVDSNFSSNINASNISNNNNNITVTSGDSHISFDVYISHLLNGGSSSPSFIDINHCPSTQTEASVDVVNDPTSCEWDTWSYKRDLDLMEMISSPQFYPAGRG